MIQRTTIIAVFKADPVQPLIQGAVKTIISVQMLARDMVVGSNKHTTLVNSINK